MLSNLQIENIAIIKNAVIDFNDGFNVMTGETGAGKSIIIDSLNAVLGERTSRELIRTGCDFASVSAVFYDKSDAVNSILRELDILPEDDGSIIISRKITADGKNNCKINGVSVTVSSLKKLGAFLVNIHGQLDNQALLNPEFHMSYIDSIADNAGLIEKYRQSYNEYTETLKALEKLNVDEEQKMRRLDTLSYQIKEIENAHIVPGEYASLKEKQSFYRNAEKLTAALNSAYEALNGNSDIDGAVSLSFAASNKLNNCADMPESVKQLYNEAGLIYNKSPRAACALLRLAIERLCNELGEVDRDINNNIGALVKKGLSKDIQQALDVVRVWVIKLSILAL